MLKPFGNQALPRPVHSLTSQLASGGGPLAEEKERREMEARGKEGAQGGREGK